MEQACPAFTDNGLFLNILLAANLQIATFLAVLVVILLILSFLISGAEISFFSLTFRDINMLKTKQDAGWKRIAYLLEEPRVLAGCLIIANSLVNIAIIIISNILVDELIVFRTDGAWPFVKLLMKVILIAGIIVLFGEVLPKIRAAHNNLRVSYESVYLVEVLYYLFRRASAWFVRLSDQVEKYSGGSVSRAVSQQQLEEAIRSTVEEEGEQRMLTGIYKFGNITVKQVMRTRLDVNGIEFNTRFKDLKQKISELHYSRLPVFKTSLDNVVGMIHTKDMIQFLNESDDFDWHRLIRQPYFVHEQKFIEDLLKEFQTRRIHFAVVVDEFGGTSGIVTMEDILEEIVGDIRDEFDEEENAGRKIDENTFILDGTTTLRNACSIMNLSEDTFDTIRGESDSIAGLMLEVAGEIPRINDSFTRGDFVFTILEVDRNRIRKVKIAINRQKD